MRGVGAGRRGVVAVACVAAALIGCGRSTPSGDVDSGTPVSRGVGGPRSIELPDLSPMVESVQVQLREAYEVLGERLARTGTNPTELAEAYGALGNLLMAAEYFDPAEDCYINAIALTPTDPRWAYYLGHLHRSTGNLAGAAEWFEAALRLRPQDVAALVWLGDVYLEAGRPEAGESLFERALSLEPELAAAAFGLGRAALAREDHAEAVRLLEQALVLDASASSIYYPLSLAYRGLGDLGAAGRNLGLRGDVQVGLPDPLMQEVSQLLESVESFEFRGSRALAREDWAAAVAMFGRGVELAPANPSIRHQLGTALALAGDTDAALSQFEQVVKLAPDFTRGRLSLGVLLESLGQRAEAIAHLEAAVQADPRGVDVRLRLAQILQQMGRSEEAFSHLQAALDSDPRLTEVRFAHAMTLVQLRRYREARDRLIEGVRTNPADPRFAHALVRVLAAAPDDQIRDGDRALTLVRALVENQQPSIELTETMAMVLAEVGEYGEAAAWQRDAVAAATQAGMDAVAIKMLDNLVLYQRGDASRTPWRSDELPPAPGGGSQ